MSELNRETVERIAYDATHGYGDESQMRQYVQLLADAYLTRAQPDNAPLTLEECRYRGKINPLSNRPYISTGCGHSLQFDTDLSEWHTCPFCGRQKKEDGNDAECRKPEPGGGNPHAQR